MHALTVVFFFSSRRRHTRWNCDWSSDVCSSDLFQVVADRFPVPWGLLYFGDAAEGATIDPELFLGMRHVVEQIPLQTGMLVDDTVIDSGSPSLAVSVNVNADIDGGQLKLDGVARQLAYWNSCATSAGARLTVAPRRTRDELLGALREGARDQLMYLYCHAVTNAPDDPGGIRNAAFQLTGGERVTLGDLYRESPTTKPRSEERRVGKEGRSRWW